MKRSQDFSPVATMMLLEESKEREALLAFSPRLFASLRRDPMTRGRAGTRPMALRLREKARRHLREVES